MITDSTVASTAAGQSIRNSTFLVVDDFSTMRRIVATLVRELGAERVVEAENGVQAWKKIELGGIDFVISDWNMPEMNGLELLKKVRAESNYRDMPFLLITAEARTDNIVEAVQSGADGYVVKPFTATVLAAKIANVLKRRAIA